MQNEYQGSERRKYRRVLFTPDRIVEGVVVFETADKEHSLKIADISVGGLRFMLKRGATGTIKMGDICFLRRIVGQLDVHFQQAPEIEIRWIMDVPAFQFVMIGGEFKNLSDQAADQLEHLVNAELARLADQG